MYCEDHPVRCNWCGWEGKEKELWFDLIHEEDICPECKKQGCIMDLEVLKMSILKDYESDEEQVFGEVTFDLRADIGPKEAQGHRWRCCQMKTRKGMCPECTVSW